MMYMKLIFMIPLLMALLAAITPAEAEQMTWNENTSIDEVISYPAFEDWGRLIFPVDAGYYSGSTLGRLRLTWYSNIQPAKTVEIVNWMKEKADAGEKLFFDIYTQEEKAADPAPAQDHQLRGKADEAQDHADGAIEHNGDDVFQPFRVNTCRNH